MKKNILSIATLVLLLCNVSSASVLPLENGDLAMIEHEPGIYQEVVVMYIENGMARIRGDKPNRGDLFQDMWLATVPVKSLVHPLAHLQDFKLGDKVCLNKNKSTFKKGFCSKIYRIYESGHILLWNGLFTSDVIVDINDINHRN